jgi:hypothetical protein
MIMPQASAALMDKLKNVVRRIKIMGKRFKRKPNLIEALMKAI